MGDGQHSPDVLGGLGEAHSHDLRALESDISSSVQPHALAAPSPLSPVLPAQMIAVELQQQAFQDAVAYWSLESIALPVHLSEGYHRLSDCTLAYLEDIA